MAASADNLNKNKAKATSDSNWLNSGDAMNLGKSNPTNNNESRNGLKLPTTVATVAAVEDIAAIEDSLMQPTTMAPITSTMSHYIDAFSDLDPLGTGKIRPYIDKKYFFQDLKNPPKKVLKDISDRDGFSTSFSADARNAAEFALFHEKSAIDNAQRKSEHSDDFGAQFTSSTQIFSPNNNGTHGTPPNMSRSSEDGKLCFVNWILLQFNETELFS